MKSEYLGECRLAFSLPWLLECLNILTSQVDVFGDANGAALAPLANI